MNLAEQIENVYFAQEKISFESGVHTWQLNDGTIVLSVSLPVWKPFLNHVNQLTDSDQVVVSPELITVTDIPFDQLLSARKIIESRIEEIIRISTIHPLTTYVIGTPLFEADKKPRNSALIIRAGDIRGQTNKRTGVT